MISLFTSMIPTQKWFPAYEIADMPAVFIDRILDFLLSFSLDSRERCEGTAYPVALVFTAATQRGARSIAEDFCVRPVLVSMTFHVLRVGAAPARADYLDPTRRTRPDMTR